MLTADLIRWRRRGDSLEVRLLDDKARERLLPFAQGLIDAATAHVDRPRADFAAACTALPVGVRDRRIADGLVKLVEDRCTFEAVVAQDPVELRAAVFQSACVARQTLPLGATFDRELVLAAVAEALNLTVEQIDAGLYADLRDAQMLTAFTPLPAAKLLVDYDLAQQQAVLLRATRVVVDVECADATGYRHLFAKLKFRRLLYTITRRKRGYRLEIDGPHSLMQAVTKYGLQLALVLPAIRTCTRWRLTAELLWGKERTRLDFDLEGEAPAPTGRRRVPKMPEEVEALVARFRKLDAGWTVKRAKRVLDLPGVGVCAPDLEFRHPDHPKPVYLEVMGYWSRAAVWKRVALVEAGLPDRIIFAVSKRLRVSEAVLGDDHPGSLYVYAGVLSARQVLERLTATSDTNK